MTLKDFMQARLKEPSTWRGLILLVGGLLGWSISPENQEAIISMCLMLAGVLGAATPDK